MLTSHLRTRYLAAMGLTTGILAGCHEGGGGTTPDLTASATATETAVVTATATEATAVATVTAPVTVGVVETASASVAYWVPKEPLPKNTSLTPTPGPVRNLPTCPNGKFCVSEANAKGSAAAAAPFSKCAESIASPEKDFERRSVSFNAVTTKRERASKADACCYDWYIPCPGGRPLVVAGEVRTAEVVRGDAWLGESRFDDGFAFSGDGRETAALLADHYEREARYEHASVAAFARLSLCLLAHGAPADLVAESHRAALDEIEHARTMFRVASALRGADVAPGPLDIGGVELGSTSIADIGLEAVREGCAGEVAAAIVLLREAELAGDPRVRSALERMAEEEERHAELAFRTARWALSVRPLEVRAALERARDEFMDELRRETPEPDCVSRLPGVTTRSERMLARRAALRDVTLPCLDALLAITDPASA